ncbi:MAG: alanine--glyoxylate aminotransferase family protein [Nitrososphaerota archaeon]|nr:alanine--glyoxylate aminotransferase family protein [Nitrososphaerota archaeon]
MTILTPGPTEIPDDVLLAMRRSSNPDIDVSFMDLYQDLTTRIKGLIHMNGKVYIMSGEGMLGLEAAIANTVRKGDRVLSVANGVFGDAFGDLASAYGAQTVKLHGDYDIPIDPHRVDPAGFDVITTVHVDTPAGLMNPIEELSHRIKGSDAIWVLDAVSSVGGYPIDCEQLGVDICLMASQKAFSAPPGLAIVAVSERAADMIKERRKDEAYGGFYMNFRVWDENLSNGMFPYTPSANDIFALARSVETIMKEGPISVYKRHTLAKEATLKALVSLGLKPYVKDSSFAATTVTAFYSPPDQAALINYMWSKFGTLLAGSWGALAGKVMRIGHMGYTAQRKFVVEAISALAAGLKHYGTSTDLPSALEDIDHVYGKR